MVKPETGMACRQEFPRGAALSRSPDAAGRPGAAKVMEWFDVTREQIAAVLEFAARSLDAPPPANRQLASADAPFRLRIEKYSGRYPARFSRHPAK